MILHIATNLADRGAHSPHAIICGQFTIQNWELNITKKVKRLGSFQTQSKGSSEFFLVQTRYMK